MNQQTSISIWSIIGFALGGFLLLVFTAFSAIGLPPYYAVATIIGADFVLSYCAAVFSGSAGSFVIGYSMPLILVAVSNTIALSYSLLSVRVALLWLGFAALVVSVGFASGHIGCAVARRRSHAHPGETKS